MLLLRRKHGDEKTPSIRRAIHFIVFFLQRTGIHIRHRADCRASRSSLFVCEIKQYSRLEVAMQTPPYRAQPATNPPPVVQHPQGMSQDSTYDFSPKPILIWFV